MDGWMDGWMGRTMSMLGVYCTKLVLYRVAILITLLVQKDSGKLT